MGSLLLSVESFFGPLWLGIFGVFRLQVWQQSGQGICFEINSRCRRGSGENVVERSKAAAIVVCLFKLCLSPLPLRTARPAPSLQSQSSGSWPSSPWLWHSGTRPKKEICMRKLAIPLKMIVLRQYFLILNKC